MKVDCQVLGYHFQSHFLAILLFGCQESNFIWTMNVLQCVVYQREESTCASVHLYELNDNWQSGAFVFQANKVGHMCFCDF